MWDVQRDILLARPVNVQTATQQTTRDEHHTSRACPGDEWRHRAIIHFLFRITRWPSPSRRTVYCLMGRSSLVTAPVLSHLLVTGSWICTSSPTDNLGSTLRYLLDSWRILPLRAISLSLRSRCSVQFWLMRSSLLGTGTPFLSCRPKRSCAGDFSPSWRGVLGYCNNASTTRSVARVPLPPKFSRRMRFAVLTASSARPFDWGGEQNLYTPPTEELPHVIAHKTGTAIHWDLLRHPVLAEVPEQYRHQRTRREGSSMFHSKPASQPISIHQVMLVPYLQKIGYYPLKGVVRRRGHDQRFCALGWCAAVACRALTSTVIHIALETWPVHRQPCSPQHMEEISPGMRACARADRVSCGPLPLDTLYLVD